MNGLVLREASSCPDGLQISAWRTDKISKCIGIDSTELSIEKTTYYLWMAVDLVNREPIAYEITEKKDEATVLEFLFKIKLMLQHEPDFVVTDMDPTLLSCVRLVFPNTIHQGCTFHRAKDNNDFMPTSLEYSHPTFRPFKILCKKIVAAKTIPHQAKYLKRMILEEKKWKSDLRTGKAYDSLMHHIHYYNTAEELGQCPFTNNLTERLIKLVKDLHNDMNGFKTLAAARAHIKGYWWYRRYTEKQGDGHSKKKKTPTSGRFLELIRHAGRMSHYRKWFREIEMKNSDAIATLLYDTNESFTTNEIAIMLTKVWKSIDVRNISREVTSEGKDLLPYVRKEDDSNRIYLTASGREWYAKILLPRLL
jgi:transposase-like protein